jgi:lipopolysaccharide biosynthesis glycosyltransferase
MGYFVRKNRVTTSKLIKQEVIDKEVNIDAVIQGSIIEEVNIIPEKKDIKKKTHMQEEPVYKTTVKLVKDKKDENLNIGTFAKKIDVEEPDPISKANIKMNRVLPERYALTTILNNPFADHFYVFINSFLENNPWFNGDLIIMYSDELSPLSDEKINELQLFYRKTIFKKIDTTGHYNDVINLFKSKISKNFHRFVPSVLTIETFNLIDYDKVLYLDSDMLVVNSLRDLYLIDHDIAVTRDTSSYIRKAIIKKAGSDDVLLNGGFLLLSGSFMRSAQHVKNMLNLFPKLTNPKFLDQSLLNEYFKDFDVLFLSSDYNLLKRCFDDTKAAELSNSLKDIKVIHYVGEKPWNIKQKEFEKNYKAIEKLWLDYSKKYRYLSVNLGSVSLVSSGIGNEMLYSTLPEILQTRVVTTNWGFKLSNVFDIDYYYCTTNEVVLLDEITNNHFNPDKLWLLTNNVRKTLKQQNPTSTHNVDPFDFMCARSNSYYAITKRREQNKKLPLPTSGVSMMLFFSLLDTKRVNIIGYNLYSRMNEDGSFKEHGVSKFINPYADDNKPHTLDFDLNFVIIALSNFINKNVKVKFYDSDIIRDIYEMMINGFDTGEIITTIKAKYYEEGQQS